MPKKPRPIDKGRHTPAKTVSEPTSRKRRKAVGSLTSYDNLREGDTDPTTNKNINILVIRTPSYIVYLDDEYYVEWSYNDKYKGSAKNLGQVVNRVTYLETLSMGRLGVRHMAPFRRLLGEAIARVLDEDDAKSAHRVLDQAQEVLEVRSTETARKWYLSSSLAVCTVASGIGILMASLDPTSLLIRGALFGSIGAMISVIHRLPEITLDAAAGPAMLGLEGAARVIVGVAGAALCAIAIKANIILGFSNTLESSNYLLFAVCIVAGASERMVPNLIQQVEASVQTDTKNAKNAKR